jgi:4-aminobutyrate aminotransferase-like enzyme
MVMAKGEKFLAALRGLQKKYKNIADVDGLGLALRVEICEKDGRTPSKLLTDKIVERGLSGKLRHGAERVGLILDVGGYYKNVLTLAPSLYIDDKEMAMSIELFDQIFAEVF